VQLTVFTTLEKIKPVARKLLQEKQQPLSTVLIFFASSELLYKNFA